MAHTAYAENLRFELRVTLLDPTREFEPSAEAVAPATVGGSEFDGRTRACIHDWPAELDSEATCSACGLAYVEWPS